MGTFLSYSCATCTCTTCTQNLQFYQTLFFLSPPPYCPPCKACINFWIHWLIVESVLYTSLNVWSRMASGKQVRNASLALRKIKRINNTLKKKKNRPQSTVQNIDIIHTWGCRTSVRSNAQCVSTIVPIFLSPTRPPCCSTLAKQHKNVLHWVPMTSFSKCLHNISRCFIQHVDSAVWMANR